MIKTLFRKDDYRGFSVTILLDMTAEHANQFVWRCERDEGPWILCTGGRASTAPDALKAAEAAIALRQDAGPEEEHSLTDHYLF